MADEERDVPELPAILIDINNLAERLDKLDPEAVTTQDLLKLIRNDLVPFLKDAVESTWYGFEDIQDQVTPIELTGAEAQEIATLLQATAQSNPQLAERIQVSLDALGLGDEDEDEDDDEGDAN